MRVMGNKERGVPADTLARWDVATQPGYNIDPGLPTQAVPGTTQVIEVGARPDWEIQQHIVWSTTTGGGTNGVPPGQPIRRAVGRRRPQRTEGQMQRRRRAQTGLTTVRRGSTIRSLPAV
jgi:hypothetical protein